MVAAGKARGDRLTDSVTLAAEMIRRAIGDAVLEIRDITLSKDDPGDAYLCRKPAVEYPRLQRMISRGRVLDSRDRKGRLYSR